jgi:Ca2+-binding RTX toxin-like protein
VWDGRTTEGIEGEIFTRIGVEQTTKRRNKAMSRRWLLGTLMAAVMIVMGASVAYAATRVECSLNKATCIGTEDDDYIFGTREPNLIYGLGGDDNTNARADRDTVFGNTGNDVLIGHDGGDTLRGNMGDDVLIDWKEGNDADKLFGGRGRDRLRSQDGDNLDTLDCGLGIDTVQYADPGDRIAENCENPE